MRLGLRFERGETVPMAHSTVFMRGMAGVYRVRIHSIVSQRTHPNEEGVTLLEVNATRKIMEETKH